MAWPSGEVIERPDALLELVACEMGCEADCADVLSVLSDSSASDACVFKRYHAPDRVTTIKSESDGCALCD